MVRRFGIVVTGILLAGCGGGATPTAAPTAAQTTAVATVAATPAPTTAATATPPTKPLSLPRTTDVPLDGSCEAGGPGCLGMLEAGKTYTTTQFTPKVSFKAPPGGWDNPNEAGGEMPLFSTKDVGDVLFFFSYARSADPKVGYTVQEIADWVSNNPAVKSTSAPASIGGLDGVTMDLEIAPGAVSDDPQCPVQVCITKLFRGDDPKANDPYPWHWDWGLAGTEKMRIYLLDADGVVVLLIADSIDGATFDTITASFDAMAPSIRFDLAGS